MHDVPTTSPNLVAEIDGAIGILTFSDPERRNPLTTEIFLALHDILSKWREAGTVRVVIVRGAGERAFSSGYDIGAIPLNPSPDRQRIMREESPLERGLDAVRDYPYPVIAMIRGACFGAAVHLAMCCDIRLGADDVKIGMPPAKLGLVYPPDGVAVLFQVLGAARAREVFYTGRTYRGAEALETGLVDRMFPAAELEKKTFEMAGEIAANAPMAVRGLKRVIRLLEEASALGPEGTARARKLCERRRAGGSNGVSRETDAELHGSLTAPRCRACPAPCQKSGVALLHCV
jgi:enoyl-CoA hydratase